jgi:hypothetical protein
MGVGTCRPGTWACDPALHRLVCQGEVRRQDAAVPQCGVDLDCDGIATEGVQCTAGASTTCNVCGSTTNGDHPPPGTQNCFASCAYGGCSAIYGVLDMANGDDAVHLPNYSSATLPGCTTMSRTGGMLTMQDEVQQCGMIEGTSLDLPNGTYVATIRGGAASNFRCSTTCSGRFTAEIVRGTNTVIVSSPNHPASDLIGPDGLRLTFSVGTGSATNPCSAGQNVRVRLTAVQGGCPGQVVFGCLNISSIVITH